MDVALGLDLRQRGPQSSPELPQSSPRCPPELPRAPPEIPCYRWLPGMCSLLPLAVPQSSPELPCYRWLPGTCSLLPLAVKHTLKAPPSQRRPGGMHSRVRACRGGPERPKIDLEQRPGGTQKCCTVCAGRSFSRVGSAKLKMRCLKVLYCVHRTLIFERTLREMETSPRKRSIPTH